MIVNEGMGFDGIDDLGKLKKLGKRLKKLPLKIKRGMLFPKFLRRKHLGWKKPHPAWAPPAPAPAPAPVYPEAVYRGPGAELPWQFTFPVAQAVATPMQATATLL